VGGKEMIEKYKFAAILLGLSLILLVTACEMSNQQPGATAESTRTATGLQTNVINTPRVTRTITETPGTTVERVLCSWYMGCSSPDGKYTARLKSGDWITTKDQIEINEINGALLWTIPSQLDPPVGDPHPSLNIYGWSKDSSRLYFRYLFLPDGGGFEFWWDGFDLQSIDIATGVIKKVIPVDGSISFAFSPDETKIAYIRADDDPQSIVILTFATGYEKKASIEGISGQVVVMGNIRWAPDGHNLAFLVNTQDYLEYIFFLDTFKMNPQKMILSPYIYEGWTSNNLLRFLHGWEDSYIIVDPLNREIISVLQMTPTPRP
jgi:hypothetical protein